MDPFVLWMRQALNPVVVFHVKRQGNPQMPSQTNPFLSQPAEGVSPANRFHCFPQACCNEQLQSKACHTWQGKHLPLRVNHQLRRSCGLVEQMSQTTVRFFWMENNRTCPERCVVIFSSYLPLQPHLRKVFLVLLIGDRSDNCSSLWVKPWPPYLIAELLLTSERPRYKHRSSETHKGEGNCYT